MSGAELIAAERLRQIESEKWSSEHDDGWQGDQLALAAACYALPNRWRLEQVFQRTLGRILWPWDQRWFKPTPEDRVRELTKAGALIAAEIDRLQRRAAK